MISNSPDKLDALSPESRRRTIESAHDYEEEEERLGHIQDPDLDKAWENRADCVEDIMSGPGYEPDPDLNADEMRANLQRELIDGEREFQRIRHAAELMRRAALEKEPTSGGSPAPVVNKAPKLPTAQVQTKSKGALRRAKKAAAKKERPQPKPAAPKPMPRKNSPPPMTKADAKWRAKKEIPAITPQEAVWKAPPRPAPAPAKQPKIGRKGRKHVNPVQSALIGALAEANGRADAMAEVVREVRENVAAAPAAPVPDLFIELGPSPHLAIHDLRENRRNGAISPIRQVQPADEAMREHVRGAPPPVLLNIHEDDDDEDPEPQQPPQVVEFIRRAIRSDHVEDHHDDEIQAMLDETLEAMIYDGTVIHDVHDKINREQMPLVDHHITRMVHEDYQGFEASKAAGMPFYDELPPHVPVPHIRVLTEYLRFPIVFGAACLGAYAAFRYAHWVASCFYHVRDKNTIPTRECGWDCVIHIDDPINKITQVHMTSDVWNTQFYYMLHNRITYHGAPYSNGTYSCVDSANILVYDFCRVVLSAMWASSWGWTASLLCDPFIKPERQYFYRHTAHVLNIPAPRRDTRADATALAAVKHTDPTLAEVRTDIVSVKKQLSYYGVWLDFKDFVLGRETNVACACAEVGLICQCTHRKRTVIDVHKRVKTTSRVSLEMVQQILAPVQINAERTPAEIQTAIMSHQTRLQTVNYNRSDVVTKALTSGSAYFASAVANHHVRRLRSQFNIRSANMAIPSPH